MRSAPDGDVEASAPVLPELPGQDVVEAPERLLLRQTRQEPEQADVDPQQRRARGRRARHRQQGPVAAHDQDQVAEPADAVARHAAPARKRLGRVRFVDDLSPPLLEGLLERARQPQGWSRAGFGHETDATELRGDTGPLHPAQFTRNPSRNSALPRAPRIGDSSEPSRSRRSSRPSASISSTTRRRVCSDRTTPPRGTSLRPASNCGLTRTTASPPGFTRAITAGRTSRSEMKETSTTARSTGSGTSASERRRALTRSRRTHARVGAKLRVELSVADVDRVDARRAALEQTVREAPGRGAHVQANLPGGVDPERVEGRRELDASARDVRVRRSRHRHDRAGRHRLPRLLGAAPVHLHEAGQDQGLRLLPRRGQSPRDQENIQARAVRALHAIVLNRPETRPSSSPPAPGRGRRPRAPRRRRSGVTRDRRRRPGRSPRSSRASRVSSGPQE